ncbi:hypothetical protein ADK52_20080 [Streptomyces sp. WM6372]|nr:hypothetical protein ADK52_20080 [Streptomyces sp. WM6372]
MLASDTYLQYRMLRSSSRSAGRVQSSSVHRGGVGHGLLAAPYVALRHEHLPREGQERFPDGPRAQGTFICEAGDRRGSVGCRIRPRTLAGYGLQRSTLHESSRRRYSSA